MATFCIFSVAKNDVNYLLAICTLKLRLQEIRNCSATGLNLHGTIRTENRMHYAMFCMLSSHMSDSVKTQLLVFGIMQMKLGTRKMQRALQTARINVINPLLNIFSFEQSVFILTINENIGFSLLRLISIQKHHS